MSLTYDIDVMWLFDRTHKKYVPTGSVKWNEFVSSRSDPDPSG